MKHWYFWFPWILSTLLASVLIYFFLAGLVDGTVSSFNIGLWCSLLLAVIASIGGSLLLKRADHPLLGTLPLLILLIPGLLFAAYASLFIFGHGRMN